MPIVVEQTAECQQPHGSEVGGICREIQLISGELLPYELVEWFVVVEGPNDVVAVGIGKGANASIAVHQDAVFRIGIPGNVQPVPPPAFAIPRTLQETLDEPLHMWLSRLLWLSRILWSSCSATRRGVAERLLYKFGNLFGRWREAEQIKAHAPNQCSCIRRFGDSEILFTELTVDESIDRMFVALDRWSGDGLKRPVLPSGFLDVCDNLLSAARIMGSLSNPGCQVFDLGIAQFAARGLWRHLQLFIAIRDRADQQTR